MPIHLNAKKPIKERSNGYVRLIVRPGLGPEIDNTFKLLDILLKLHYVISIQYRKEAYEES